MSRTTSMILILGLAGLCACEKAPTDLVPSGVKGEISTSYLVSNISPATAPPGKTITVEGVGFTKELGIRVNGTEVSTFDLTSSETVSFALPETKVGLTKIVITKRGETTSLPFLVTSRDGRPVIPEGDEDSICKGEKFYSLTGELRTGDRPCGEELPLCEKAGQTNCITTEERPAADTSELPTCNEDLHSSCVATEEFPAVDKASLDSQDLRQGATVAGVDGSLEDCAEDGATECVATPRFKAADTEAFSGADLKSGVTIAGDPGQIVDCLQDGDENCYASGVFVAANVSGISPWDIRINKTVAGKFGQLRYCKNTANTENVYDDTSAPGETGLDVYDTIDNFNNDFDRERGVPSDRPFGDAYACGTHNWKDVSRNADGAETTCSASSDDCMMLDKITNLVWSEKNPGGSKSDFWQAQDDCHGLSFGGHSDWRVPTQDELYQAYIDGIFDAHVNLAPAWIDTMRSVDFWSSTTKSWGTSDAFYMRFTDGKPGFLGKSYERNVICVRNITSSTMPTSSPSSP